MDIPKLDELDKELERRRHSFCHYADDCNIYVSCRKAGEHILKEIRGFLENKLKLKVNEKKSAAARPWERKYPGIQCYMAQTDESEDSAGEREKAEG